MVYDKTFNFQWNEFILLIQFIYIYLYPIIPYILHYDITIFYIYIILFCINILFSNVWIQNWIYLET